MDQHMESYTNETEGAFRQWAVTAAAANREHPYFYLEMATAGNDASAAAPGHFGSPQAAAVCL